MRPVRAKHVSAGYPQRGDKADIWAMWVARGRKGAAELIARYGAATRRRGGGDA